VEKNGDRKLLKNGEIKKKEKIIRNVVESCGNSGTTEEIVKCLSVGIIWIATRCQFHQRFTYKFFVQTSFWAAFSRYVSALVPKFCTKNACVNVDEIDGSFFCSDSKNVFW